MHLNHHATVTNGSGNYHHIHHHSGNANSQPTGHMSGLALFDPPGSPNLLRSYGGIDDFSQLEIPLPNMMDDLGNHGSSLLQLDTSHGTKNNAASQNHYDLHAAKRIKGEAASQFYH